MNTNPLLIKKYSIIQLIKSYILFKGKGDKRQTKKGVIVIVEAFHKILNVEGNDYFKFFRCFVQEKQNNQNQFYQTITKNLTKIFRKNHTCVYKMIHTVYDKNDDIYLHEKVMEHFYPKCS